jgi:hypothetical protein
MSRHHLAPSALRSLALTALLVTFLAGGSTSSANASLGAGYRPDSTCTGDRALHPSEPSAKDAIASSDVIFVGNPFGVHDPVPLSVQLPDDEMVIDIGFKVLRAWKGGVEDTVWVRTMRYPQSGGWAIGTEFTYLVYARRYGDVIWTDSCSRSRLARNSETDLYYLGKPTFDDGSGGVPEVTIETLLQTVRDHTGTQRLLAMQAVSHIKEEAAQVLPVLTEVYRTGRGSERSEAINAIGNMGEQGRGAVPLLLEATADSASYIRQAAASSLGQIGDDSPEVVDALVRLTADPETVVRGMAARGLGRLGVGGEKVVAALTPLLEDRTSFCRESARAALDSIAEKAKKQ